MQFGTGIAKQSNKSKFGSNRQAKGDSEYILSKENFDVKNFLKKNQKNSLSAKNYETIEEN